MDLSNLNLFSSQTVFVLGAGASNPYHFPLGADLKRSMIDHLEQPNIGITLNSAGFDETIINNFRDALRYSYHPTIDIFLEKKTGFRDIGSHVIALTLIPFENDAFIFPQRDWYGVLFDLLDFENGGISTTYPSFVSLNYDRSLEHFLNKNIDYNCKDEKIDRCHEENQKIKIIHAHGSLGSYPDLPYGSDATDPEVLIKAAESIKIVSDSLDNSPDFQEAKQVISQASNIVFLGFGYDETTLSKLLGKTDLNSKKFYGTGVGFQFNPSIRTQLEHKFGDNFITEDGLDCKKLFEQIRLVVNSDTN